LEFIVDCGEDSDVGVDGSFFCGVEGVG